MRIGIIRESMLTFPGVKADEPIVKAADAEIKQWLGDYLGATLVESSDPKWPDDPAIENMTTSYTKALAELIPVFFPDILYRVQTGEGGRRRGAAAGGGSPKPVFPDFAAAITPTPFAPGVTFGSGTMAPADYLVALADGKVPVPGQPQHPDGAAAGAVEGLPLPLRAVRDAARRRLEGARLRGDAGRLPDAQRPLEVLGRRPARRVQELGGDDRTSATRSTSGRASTSASCCASCCAASR